MKIKNKIMKIRHKIMKINYENKIVKTKIYILRKNVRKFWAFFIIKQNEMIGNPSSYDKMKNIDEDKNNIFYKKVPQDNSVHFSLLNIMK